MKEKIKDLKKICQSTAKKDVSNIYMRYVCRNISIYLTRWVLPTGVTANQVSFAMIIAGCLAGLLLMIPDRMGTLAGALMLQVWYLIDCMDGEVARYRIYEKSGQVVETKTQTAVTGPTGMTGMYFDMINHYMVNFLVPVMLGLSVFFRTKSSFLLFIAVLGGLGQVLMLAWAHAGSATLLNHMKRYERLSILSHERMNAETPQTGIQKKSAAHRAFMLLHYTMTYPTVMNMVLITAVFNFLWASIPWTTLFVMYLSLGSLVVSITLISRIIRTDKLDAEFRQGFEPVETERDAPVEAPAS